MGGSAPTANKQPRYLGKRVEEGRDFTSSRRSHLFLPTLPLSPAFVPHAPPRLRGGYLVDDAHHVVASGRQTV